MALLPSVWRENVNDNSAISHGGREFYVNAENSWSFDSKDNSTLRFEVRQGDRYVSSGYTDSSGVERSEMGDVARYSISQNVSVEYKFMIEPGSKNTAKWMVLGQLHSAMNASPPVEIKFLGNDKMKISGNSGSSGNIKYKDIYSDSQDIVRGHWYTMKMNIKFDPYGNGRAEIWRDGVKIVDYSGAIGYTDQTNTYWKEGVYRSTAPETTAVNYKDLVIKTGANAFAASAGSSFAPGATVVSVAKVATESIAGTTKADYLVGGSGDDILSGYAGKDKLKGGAGNDRLDGGSNDDSLWGGDGNDFLRGGSGHDSLYGNNGADRLYGNSGNDRLSGSSGNDRLYGNNGNDRLSGGNGDDRLIGGTGLDVLTGGKGRDTFVFTGKLGSSNVDTITDFSSSNDTIQLWRSAFKEMPKGQLDPSAFVTGFMATSSEDRIIYDTGTGNLSYDPDGAGGVQQVHIATLRGAPALTASDFFIV